MRARVRRRVVLPLAAAVALFAGGQALAGPTPTVSATNATTDYTAGTDTPTIAGGGRLNFQNNGTVSHSVTADGTGPDAKPLFNSGIFSNDTREVRGTKYLTDGTYAFHCSVHPQMKGTLTVNDGSPVPRPNIDVKIKSRSLGKVRRTRRLKVEVDAHTKSDNVALTAKKGRKTLAHKSNIDLGAGDSDTLALRLSRKGRRALKGLDSAKVKLTGTVPFGSPDTAKRTLS